MDRKVIFVMGPGHCGSTLFDLIMGSHSDVFSLGEFHRIHRAIDDFQEGYPKICGVCTGRCEFWNQRASLPILKMYFSRKNKYRSLFGKVSQCVFNPYKFLFKWSEKSVLVDSSKQPSWFRRRLTPSYTWRDMVPYLIYMCRDGRAVVNSYLRKYPERGIANIAENWKRQINEMNKFYENFPSTRRMKVKYEELATYPERVGQSICNFVDLKYEKEMVRYWTHEHHHLFGNGGTKSLIFKYRMKFEHQSVSLQKRLNNNNSKKYYGSKYYQEVGLAIKLDLRWHRELSQEQLEVFDSIAGNTNKPFIYE